MPTTAATLAIVGSTASGKTRLSLELAEALARDGAPLEIVNADAMARYRGMDIGTAKATAAERERTVHHQLDVLDPSEEGSVREYQVSARQDAAGARSRGALPAYVGGSGLYLRAALDELDIPPTDPAVRARLEAEAAEIGPEALHARLNTVDPVAAAQIAPANVRRVVRALEVVELTGRPFSASRPTPTHHLPTLVLGVRVPQDALEARIHARAARMLDDGLVEEALAVRAAGWGRTAATAVGYPQALDLADGRADRAETIEAITMATRRLAKRQRTWFRADPRIHWLDLGVDGVGPDVSASAATGRAVDLVRRFLDGVGT